jgi:hypothetical protein
MTEPALPVVYKIQVLALVDSTFWPPKHDHPESFCWVFKKLIVVPNTRDIRHNDNNAVVLWEQQRVPSVPQFCQCTRHLPPAYGGPFKLTCACGRNYTSGRAEKEPIYIWKEDDDQ